MAKTKLPQRPGHYLWFRLDLSYLEVGSVHVMEDRPSHIEYLRKRIEEKGAKDCGFLLYQNDDGVWLTMYHDAHDHLPPRSDDGLPYVDDYRRYNFWGLVGGEVPSWDKDSLDEDTMQFEEPLVELDKAQ